MSKDVKIVAREDITPGACKWLRVKRTTFEGQTGSLIEWEFIERTTKIAEVDGAAVLAKAVSKSRPPQVILIAQYRVPVESYVLELPAGLADEGEDMATVAVRELKEETGYTGQSSAVSVAVHGEPGITNNSLKIVTVDVDLDDPVNANPQAAHEAGELIEVFLLPLHSIHDSLVSLALERSFIIDSRLYMLALGVQQGIALASTSTASSSAATALNTAASTSETQGTADAATSAATSAAAGASTGASSSGPPKGLGGGRGLVPSGKSKRVVPRTVSKGKGKGRQAQEVVIDEKDLRALLGSGQVELVNISQGGVDEDGWEEVDVSVEDGGKKKGKSRMLAFEVEEPGYKQHDEPVTLWRALSGLLSDVDSSVLITAGAAVGVCALSIAVLAIRSSLKSSAGK